ncbi:hypothetical protein AO265_04575 [Pseudomonas sp. ABAC61]|nr:hypothetical protein AO265_04575 [Pseudomonas sp. ABAC61]
MNNNNKEKSLSSIEPPRVERIPEPQRDKGPCERFRLVIEDARVDVHQHIVGWCLSLPTALTVFSPLSPRSVLIGASATVFILPPQASGPHAIAHVADPPGALRQAA